MNFTTIKNKNPYLNVTHQEMTCDDRICEDIAPLSSYTARYVLVGPPGSGKTNFLLSVLSKNKKKGKRIGLAKVFNHVIILSPSLSTIKNNKIFDSLDSEKKFTTFDDEFLEFVIAFTDETSAENETTLVIMDGVTSQLKKSQTLVRKLGYLLQNSRHRLLSTMILSQRFIDLPTVVRETSTHLVLFRSNNRRELEYIKNEIIPLDKKILQPFLDWVYDKPYNFLFIDMSLKNNTSKFLYYKNFDLIAGI